jgi:hypothetical protein
MNPTVDRSEKHTHCGNHENTTWIVIIGVDTRRKSMDNKVDEILKHTHCGKDENTTRIALHGLAMGRRKSMNHRVNPK